MEYRQMGNTGVRVSAIGLGTNQFGGKVDQQGVDDIIAAAIDLGINLIDTADVYQGGRSEETLGVALRGRWDRVVLATKAHGAMGDGPNDYGCSRYHIMAAVEASLRRLNTDHIDLYQMHRWDDKTPIEETLRALDDLDRRRQGSLHRRVQLRCLAVSLGNLLAEVRGGRGSRRSRTITTCSSAPLSRRSCPIAVRTMWASSPTSLWPADS